MSALFATDDDGQEIELCPEHGEWYAKGCARCMRDLDAMGVMVSDDRYTITEAGRKALEERANEDR